MAKDRMDRKDRKELRQPDEFVTATAGAVEWAQKNSSTVMLIVGGLVAVFLGVGFYQSYEAAQLRDSNADLASALATYRGGEPQSAAVELSEVASKWPDTPVANLAAVLAAHSLLRAGDNDAAIAALSALDTEALPPYLRQQRDFAWASALASKKEWETAANKYAESAAIQGPYTGDSLVGQARALENAGMTERAKEIYQKVVSEYPDRIDKDLLATKAG